MEVKKTPRADLEKNKVTYFLFGLIVTLGAFYILLEWKSEESVTPEWEGLPSVFIEEEYLGSNDPIIQLPEPNIEQESVLEKIYEDFRIVEKAEMTGLNMVDTIPDQVKQEDVIAVPEIKEEITIEGDSIYSNPETLPEFPGGTIALNRFLFSHLKYPASAKTQRKQGRIWYSFVVNQDGSISNLTLESGGYISLNQEAMRVLKLMPAWKPGTSGGQTVRVKVYIPIVFKL